MGSEVQYGGEAIVYARVRRARRVGYAGIARPGRASVATAGLGQEVADDPAHAFFGHGQMKPEQLEIAAVVCALAVSGD